jgi:putative transposase
VSKRGIISIVSMICTKYRIFPTHSQQSFLSETLAICRGVYNSLLNTRKFEYEVNSKSLSLHDQINAITGYKKDFPELTTVHSQVLQNVAVRVDLAFQAFFRRVKRSDKKIERTPAVGRLHPVRNGFPRMKGEGYDSFCYPGTGFAINEASVRLSKIGVVKAIIHRKVEGTVKTCTVKRQGKKWFACLAVETQAAPLPENSRAIGIDVGIEKFAALSDGTYIQNPRFFRKDEKALAKAQRKTERYKKRSQERTKAKKVVSRIHERIKNRRHNFVHQESRKIVSEFGIIVVEDLNVKNMSKSPAPKQDVETGEFLPNGARAKAGLNKSILEAAWSMFRSALAYKAESASRKYLEINPAYTSQDCHSCGYRAKKKLSDRWHLCPKCGASLDRDRNAAINILALGVQRLGANP